MNREGTKALKIIIMPTDDGVSLMAGSVVMINRRKYNECWLVTTKLSTIIEKDGDSTPGEDSDLLTEITKIPRLQIDRIVKE